MLWFGLVAVILSVHLEVIFVLIYCILDFTFPLPFPSGSQCIVLQSTSFIQQSIFLNLGTYKISFMYASRSGSSLDPISISIDDVVISITPNISVTPWTFFTQSFVVSISKIIVVKLSGTVSSINQCTGIDNVTVALHSLYLRTVRSRTLQVRLLFRTTHYYPLRT